MKKFIASILAVCMVLTSMCFVASAATEVKTDRALNVVVDKTEVYAIDGKDTVTVTVVVADDRTNVGADDQFTVAEYVLDYDPALFTLQGTVAGAHDAANGEITETFYKTTITGWETDDVLATYTFKAIPQVNEETDTFNLVSPQIYTVRESLKGDIFEASSTSADVTILLEPYEVKKYIDGNTVTDAEDESVPDNSFPYDNEEHTFWVETVPDAVVSYTVKLDGTEITPTLDNDGKVVIKAEGIYEIEYTVTNKADGYAPVNGTYTIEIQEPVHVIEVIPDYILADDIGKNLVLVYTNTEGAVYKYNGEVMIDVSKSGYKYNDTDSYSFVYAFVAEPINKEDGSVLVTDEDAHKAAVSHVYDYTGEITAVGEYNTDVNFSGDLGIQDIAVVYGAINGHSVYFEDVSYQKYLLKSDVLTDKKLRGEDASAVVDAVKDEQN